MNKNFKNYAYMSFALALATTMASCSDDDNKVEIQETDAAYVGKEVGNFTADEWYPGGKLGTTENTGSSSYSDQTPAVDNDPELFKQFFIGEQMFERQYSWNTGAFKGLGPALSAHLVLIATLNMVMASARHSMKPAMVMVTAICS